MRANIHGVKRIVCFILTVVLLLSCTSVLCACKVYRETVQNGIEIDNEQNQEYTAQTKIFAYNSINGFFTELLKLSISNNIPEPTKNKWEEISKDVQTIIEGIGVSERTYLEVLELISERKEEYALAIYQIQKGNDTKDNLDSLKELFTTITATFGSEQTAKVLFDLACYYYDYQYEELMAEYDKYGFAYKLENAIEMAENKRILTQEIKKENFIPLTQMIYFVAELFFGGGFENSVLASFTNAEIMQFIKFPEFNQINLTDSSWKLILNLAKPLLADTKLKEKVFDKMQDNLDIDLISKKLNCVVKFFCIVQNNIDIAQAELVKQGKTQELISSIFERLDEQGWQTFESVFALQLKNDEYNQLGVAEYGENYTEYLNGLTNYTLSELKFAVDSDDFITVLKAFIKGVCPAYFYGV